MKKSTYLFIGVYIFLTQAIMAQSIAGLALCGGVGLYMGALFHHLADKTEKMYRVGFRALKTETLPAKFSQHSRSIEECQDILGCYQNRLPSGIFMYGTGNNKLELAHSLSNVPFPKLVFSAKEITDVKALFEAGQVWYDYWLFFDKKNPRILIIIEDIDSFYSSGCCRSPVFSSLLKKMSDLDSPVTVVGLSNSKSLYQIDPTLIRPGRFDCHICVDHQIMQVEDIERYIKDCIVIQREKRFVSYRLDSTIDAQSIYQLFLDLDFSMDMNTLEKFFNQAALYTEARDSATKDEIKTVSKEDLIKSVISLRGVLQKGVLSTRNYPEITDFIKGEKQDDFKKCMNFLSNQTVMMLINQIFQAQNSLSILPPPCSFYLDENNIQVLRINLIQGIKENISLLNKVCSALYGIEQEEFLIDENVLLTVINNYFVESADLLLMDYIHDRIIPEMLSRANKKYQPKPISIQLPFEPEKKNDTVPFLKIPSLNSIYAQLSCALGISALYLVYRLMSKA